MWWMVYILSAQRRHNSAQCRPGSDGWCSSSRPSDGTSQLSVGQVVVDGVHPIGQGILHGDQVSAQKWWMIYILSAEACSMEAKYQPRRGACCAASRPSDGTSQLSVGRVMGDGVHPISRGMLHGWRGSAQTWWMMYILSAQVCSMEAKYQPRRGACCTASRPRDGTSQLSVGRVVMDGVPHMGPAMAQVSSASAE
jgi:hypothetical protein